MFKILSKGCKGWQTVVGLLDTLHDEATIVIKPEGIDFRAMDLSKIGLIDFSWNKENFQIYDCNEEQKIAVDTGNLKVILDRAKNEDIELLYNGGNAIDIIMGTTKKYDLPLVHATDQPQKVNVQYSESNKISLSEFQNALEDIKIIDSHINLTVDKGILKIEAKGQWSRNNGTAIISDKNINVKESGKGRFQIDFLLNVIKAVKSATDTFDVSLSNNKPFKFTFDIKDMGKLDYYVAPIQDQ